MTTLKLRRGTFQHVESELYAYHDTKRELLRLKNEILYGTSSHDENVGGGRSNLPSDPTSRTAIALVAHRRIEQMERITEAIEWVYDRLPDEKQKLIKLRYWDRPQILNWDGIAKNIPVHRATAFRWREEIVFAVAEKIGWR